MEFPKFEYNAPSNLKEAAGLYSSNPNQVVLMGGGTDLLIRIKQRLVQPSLVISLKNVQELRGIVKYEDRIEIGACTSLLEIQESNVVAEASQGLVEAIKTIGSVQHRAAGTIAGNICLEPRCWYFNRSDLWRRAQEPCLKVGGRACYIAKSKSAKRCFAIFSGDSAAALLTLEAQVKIFNGQCEEVKPLSEIYNNEGREHIKLGANSVLTRIIVPKPQPMSVDAYSKFRLRDGVDFPIAGVAVRIVLKSRNEIEFLNVGITGVCSKPELVKIDTCQGMDPASLDIESVSKEVVSQLMVIKHPRFSASAKKDIVRSLVKEAYQKAITRLNI